MCNTSRGQQSLGLYHIDLKTAFLQGESYDARRDVYCELPKEAGHPWYIVAHMKKAAYGLNDAPRRWWNVVDGKLRTYGLLPTRADRCTYVLYANDRRNQASLMRTGQEKDFDAIGYLLDPVSGNNAQGRYAIGVVCLHVDDLFMAGNSEFQQKVIGSLKKDFQVGSEDINDVQFVGQRIKWVTSEGNNQSSTNLHASKGRKSIEREPQKLYIRVDQDKCVEELSEIVFDKSLQDHIECNPSLHTQYRSLLGQINWLQSRTQVQSCYRFSRCASAAAKPTIGDVRALNKLCRRIRIQPVIVKFCPLVGKTRIIGFQDSSYRNNEDNSSHRAH